MIPDDLRENVSVRVTCTAVAPCPQFHPQLSWNLQDSWSQTLKGDDRIPKIQILTTLRLTEEDDGLNVTCVASYLVKSTFRNVTQAKTLNVSCKCFLFCIPSAKTFLLLYILTFGPCFPRWSQGHQSVGQSGRLATSW